MQKTIYKLLEDKFEKIFQEQSEVPYQKVAVEGDNHIKD